MRASHDFARRALALLLVVLGAATAAGQVQGGAAGVVESADDLEFLDELELAFRRGGSHSAQRDLDEYLEEFPASVRARRLAAEAAWRRGACRDAEAHLLAAGDPDPALRGQVLLRLGHAEDALALADDERLPTLAALRLRVAALDALGRRAEALALAATVAHRPDTSDLDGAGLADLGWLLLFDRRFELANQALVFADRELNGPHGPGYRVSDTGVLVLLARCYQAARQSGSGSGADRTLEVLADVLALDRGHAEALVVQARALTYAHNGRAAEVALQAALARDRRHPEALVLTGESRLMSRQVDAALAAADTVLADNPRQREALALRASALALSTRRSDAAAAAAAFEAAHPGSAVLAALHGRVLQAHYRFADSIPELERALALEPENEEPLAALAQSLAHVGREEDALAALEEHLLRSPFPYPWRHNMREVLKRLRDMPELATESGFRIRLPPGERDVFGLRLAAELDRARADLAARWGHAPQEPVLVEVFDEHADFSVRTVGFQGFMALGACFGNVVTLVSPLSELRRQFVWRQTALHEYAHVVTLGLSRQRVPRWLSEGVSVREECRHVAGWDRESTRELLDARANGLIAPVERMDELFQDGATVALGYYLGALVCEVVETDFGFGGLRALVAAYADDRSTGQAVEVALGISAAELDRRVRLHFDEVLAPRAAVRPHFTEAGKEHLRQAAAAGDGDALFNLARAYLDLGRPVDMDATLALVIAREGESPRVLALQAERDLARDQPARAFPRLEQWAAQGVPDADGLVLLAGLRVARGDRQQAADDLRRAVTLFPGDVGPGSATARLLELLDGDADRAERQALLDALVARDETALEERLELARLAQARGDRPRRLQLLTECVEIDPYDPGLAFDQAEELQAAGRTAEAQAQWRAVLAMRQEQVPQEQAAGLTALQERAAALLASLTAPAPASADPAPGGP